MDKRAQAAILASLAARANVVPQWRPLAEIVRELFAANETGDISAADVVDYLAEIIESGNYLEASNGV